MRAERDTITDLFAGETGPVQNVATRPRSARRVLPVLRHGFGASRGGLIGWALGLAAVISLYVPLYPSIGANDELQAIIDSLPEQLVSVLGFDQIASAAGYTQATVFGLLGFVLLTIASVSWGAAAIAGDEERGTLELTLAHAVSRGQVLFERWALLLLKLVLLTTLVGGLVTLYSQLVDLRLHPLGVTAAALALLALALLSGTTALAVGAISGRRTAATVIGAGIAITGYALTALSRQSADLAFLADYSPFSWAYGHDPLVTGITWLQLAPAGLAVGILLIGALVFSRRDVGR